MKNNRWISQAAKRYILLQLPGAVLLVIALILARRWIDIPAWLFWGLIVLWVGKDVVLFPFVRKAYEPQEDGNPMVGARGVAVEKLAPSGFIRIGGELWKAEAANRHRAIEAGAHPDRGAGLRNGRWRKNREGDSFHPEQIHLPSHHIDKFRCKRLSWWTYRVSLIDARRR
jgi:membrane protein implicated in regulation of membrane protease activity